MGGYARFVWPAYGAACAVVVWMLADSVGSYRKARRALDAIERQLR
jgi:heme exporter protein CcmD